MSITDHPASLASPAPCFAVEKLSTAALSAAVRRVLPAVAGATMGLLCAGCTGSASSTSGARIASVVLHATGPARPYAAPVAGRAPDFALPHGRGGEPYLEALPPGAVSHSHRSI